MILDHAACNADATDCAALSHKESRLPRIAANAEKLPVRNIGHTDESECRGQSLHDRGSDELQCVGATASHIYFEHVVSLNLMFDLRVGMNIEGVFHITVCFGARRCRLSDFLR